MEKVTSLPTKPMSLDDMRALLLKSTENASDEEALIEYQEKLQTMVNRVSEMFTSDVLERSESWHTIRGSNLKEDVDRLPEEVEGKVALVITDLLERTF